MDEVMCRRVVLGFLVENDGEATTKKIAEAIDLTLEETAQMLSALFPRVIFTKISDEGGYWALAVPKKHA